MKKFAFIFLFFGLLIGDQKNTGLMLKKGASTVIVPYEQNIEISFKDGKTVKNGILFNASLNTIYLKSLPSDETISIPSNNVLNIKTCKYRIEVLFIKIEKESKFI